MPYLGRLFSLLSILLNAGPNLAAINDLFRLLSFAGCQGGYDVVVLFGEWVMMT